MLNFCLSLMLCLHVDILIYLLHARTHIHQKKKKKRPKRLIGPVQANDHNQELATAGFYMDKLISLQHINMTQLPKVWKENALFQVVYWNIILLQVKSYLGQNKVTDPSAHETGLNKMINTTRQHRSETLQCFFIQRSWDSAPCVTHSVQTHFCTQLSVTHSY